MLKKGWCLAIIEQSRSSWRIARASRKWRQDLGFHFARAIGPHTFGALRDGSKISSADEIHHGGTEDTEKQFCQRQIGADQRGM